jgi:hypothetical protein
MISFIVAATAEDLSSRIDVPESAEDVEALRSRPRSRSSWTGRLFRLMLATEDGDVVRAAAAFRAASAFCS